MNTPPLTSQPSRPPTTTQSQPRDQMHHSSGLRPCLLWSSPITATRERHLHVYRQRTRAQTVRPSALPAAISRPRVPDPCTLAGSAGCSGHLAGGRGGRCGRTCSTPSTCRRMSGSTPTCSPAVGTGTLGRCWPPPTTATAYRRGIQHARPRPASRRCPGESRRPVYHAARFGPSAGRRSCLASTGLPHAWSHIT